MGSIRRETVVSAALSDVWSTLRDVGNAADAFPGILTHSRLQSGNQRLVTFSNALVVTERILDIDDANRRVAFSALPSALVHHSASMQVSDAGGGAVRFVWITDFLPDEAGSFVEPLVDEGIPCFERRWRSGENP